MDGGIWDTASSIKILEHQASWAGPEKNYNLGQRLSNCVSQPNFWWVACLCYPEAAMHPGACCRQWIGSHTCATQKPHSTANKAGYVWHHFDPTNSHFKHCKILLLWGRMWLPSLDPKHIYLKVRWSSCSKCFLPGWEYLSVPILMLCLFCIVSQSIVMGRYKPRRESKGVALVEGSLVCVLPKGHSCHSNLWQGRTNQSHPMGGEWICFIQGKERREARDVQGGLSQKGSNRLSSDCGWKMITRMK